MDFLSDIGNFFGSLFGGGDQNRKKQQPTVAPTVSANSPLTQKPTNFASVQTPSPFATNSQNPTTAPTIAPIKLGGVTPTAPTAPTASVSQPTTPTLTPNPTPNTTLNPNPQAPTVATLPKFAQPSNNLPQFLGAKPAQQPTLGSALLDAAKQGGSGVEQSLATVPDVALEGGGVLNTLGAEINPFLNSAQKQQAIQTGLNTVQSIRNGLHGITDLSGNNITGTSDVDQSAANIASGNASPQDYANVIGKGLEVGSTVAGVINPAAGIISKGISLPAAAEEGALFGGTGAAGSAASTYGQTGDVGRAVNSGIDSALLGGVSQLGLRSLAETPSNIAEDTGALAKSVNPAINLGEETSLSPQLQREPIKVPIPEEPAPKLPEIAPTETKAAITTPNAPIAPIDTPAITTPATSTVIRGENAPVASQIPLPVGSGANRAGVNTVAPEAPVAPPSPVSSAEHQAVKETLNSQAEKAPAEVPAATATPAETKAAQTAQKTAEETPAVPPAAVRQNEEIPINSPGSTEAKVSNSGDVKPNSNAVPNLPDNVKLLSSKLEAIRKTGTNAGSELADRIEAADARHEDLRANYMNGLKNVFSLNNKDFRTAWDAQEGKIPVESLSPKVQEAVAELRTVMPQIHNDASNANVVSGDLGETYMPLVFAKGKGPTVNMPTTVNTSQKSYGNLEKLRTADNQNYARTKDALLNYIDKSSQRIGQSENFGSKNEVANDLLNRIGKEGGDQGTADKAFANYMRTPFSNTTTAKVLNGVRSGFGVARLPLAAISHMGQTTNTAVDSGIANTIKAWGEHLAGNPADKDFIDRTGVTTPQSLGHYSSNYTSVPGKVANKLTAPALTNVMRANRSVTALAYRNYANKLAEAGNVDKLHSLGVTGDIGKTLTDEQQVQAARSGVQRTMFTGSNAHTPISAETTPGRIIGQYRTAYAYPQTKFIYNNILKEAGNGNLAPLSRYLALSGAVSAGTVATKNAITGRQEKPGDVGLDAAASLGGIPGESASSVLRYGASNLPATVAGVVAPAAGEAVKFLQALGSSAGTKNLTPVARYGLKLIPGVGGRLATALTPTKTEQSAAGGSPATSAPSTGNPITDAANFINGILHPAPPDAVSAEINRLGTDANIKFSAAETKALNAKSINPTAHTLLNDPIYQSADDQAKATMLKSVLSGSATKGVNASLSDIDKQALLDEKVLTNPADKKAWLDDNRNASNYYTALYDNAVANKSLNPQIDNDLHNKNSLAYKAVAAQVDEKYNADSDLKDNYTSTTQSKFNGMINPKSATYDPDTAQALYNYDQARVNAGLPPKYNLAVAQSAAAKSASRSTSGTSKSFVFASNPSSLLGVNTSGTSGSGGYASPTSLFTPIASLKTYAPTVAVIPKGRSISAVKIK